MVRGQAPDFSPPEAARVRVPGGFWPLWTQQLGQELLGTARGKRSVFLRKRSSGGCGWAGAKRVESGPGQSLSRLSPDPQTQHIYPKQPPACTRRNTQLFTDPDGSGGSLEGTDTDGE